MESEMSQVRFKARADCSLIGAEPAAFLIPSAFVILSGVEEISDYFSKQKYCEMSRSGHIRSIRHRTDSPRRA